MKVEIKRLYTGEILHIVEGSLQGANLKGLNLCYANFQSCDLRYADLSGANLRDVILNDAIGNMREIRSMQCDFRTIVWTEYAVQIGGKRYTWDEWLSFDDDTIATMGARMLGWWLEWKPVLEQIMQLSPATPAEH